MIVYRKKDIHCDMNRDQYESMDLHAPTVKVPVEGATRDPSIIG